MKRVFLAALVVLLAVGFIPSITEAAGCEIISFTGHTTAQRGQSANLSWITTGCKFVRLLATNSEGTELTGPYSIGSSGVVSTGPLISVKPHYYTLIASADVNSNTTIAEKRANFAVTVTPGFVGDGGVYFSIPPRNVVSDGVVYLVSGYYRQAYTSAGAFLSYGFNRFEDVVPATPIDLSLPVANGVPIISPRNGALINDRGTVYIIINGLRAGFTSDAVFRGFGYSYSNVIPADTSFMVTRAPITSSNDRHPWGTVVNDNGTLYSISDDDKHGIPDMATFYSFGLKPSDVVPANSYDRALPQTGVLSPRGTNSFGL